MFFKNLPTTKAGNRRLQWLGVTVASSFVLSYEEMADEVLPKLTKEVLSFAEEPPEGMTVDQMIVSGSPYIISTLKGSEMRKYASFQDFSIFGLALTPSAKWELAFRVYPYAFHQAAMRLNQKVKFQ